MNIKIFPDEYIDGTLLYEFDGMLFSIQVTEDMCRREFLESGSFIEDHEQNGEHIERLVMGDYWPMPEELEKAQLSELAIKYHEVSLKCSQDEVLELMDKYGSKFKKYRTQ